MQADAAERYPPGSLEVDMDALGNGPEDGPPPILREGELRQYFARARAHEQAEELLRQFSELITAGPAQSPTGQVDSFQINNMAKTNWTPHFEPDMPRI